jgi:O-succinylbenzoic acid--CoA ligase
MAEPLIDWYSDESHILINPFYPEKTRQLLQAAIEPSIDLKGHIWVTSSGTEHFPKVIALSKRAMLISAEAVNAHLNIQKKTSWLNVLPLFHVGGLGIHTRAMLSGSAIYDFSEEKWDPIKYVQQLEENAIAYSSLTPTHLYDIFKQNLLAPKGIKAIIISGGALLQELNIRAFQLGWPLFKSYGMTEVCSQIATATTTDVNSELTILKHIQLKINAQGFIEIKSDALLTGFVHGDDPKKKFIDSKQNGWYTTQDKGAMEAGNLKIYGRGANFLKIGGENINFSQLEAIWEEIKIQYHCHDEMALIDLPDERLGWIICLATTKKDVNYGPLIEEFHKKAVPIAKIRAVYTVDHIPRTALYKLNREELRNMILNKTFFV